ncbi:hypothetical protein L7F22_057970 [Adiantum nelumboides]|nr:hypothetical protein [Adiantum nelumboides]
MYVKKLIQSEKLDIVMLQETKIGALSLQVKGYACITGKADRGSGECMTLISNAYKVKEVLQPDCGRWIACQLSHIDWDVPLLFAGDWNCEDAELQSNEWIAWKTLREKKDSELITALRKPDGGVTEDETEIKEMFKDSLSGIVGSPMTWNEQLQQKLNNFLEPMDSKINEEKKLLLGRPFSVYEVETVVKAMKKEKTPGPDGIVAEPEFNQGLIKLIPKGQDKMEVKNYRPLTMLNTVYKVMAKALALRVRTVVSQVVHPKQFGFVQGRSIHEAMLNMIIAIDWAAEQEDEYVMINMDLEKAYDRVSWEYILAVIDRMGFGSIFLGMVKTLFQNASASIQVNGYISDSFQLARSIR